MVRPPVDLTPELVNDPIRGYAGLRERAPLVRVTLPGVETPTWLLTRYDDAKKAYNDPRFVRDRNKVPGMEGPGIEVQMMEAYGLPVDYLEYLKSLVLLDGKQHARLRAKAVRTFTARRVTELRPDVERIADDLLKQLIENGEGDLLHDFCYPLASTSICELIGVDAEDQPQMCAWIRQYAFGGDPAGIKAGIEGVVGYTKELIERRRVEPTGDLISGLLWQGEDADRPTETEMISLVFVLINTGHHPPAHFIANAVLTLLDNPGELARLRAGPELLSGAIHELLRVISPVSIGASMYATEDLEFAGCPVNRGESVTSALLAVNHDPGEFGRPERLDLSRAPKRGEHHLAFGHGAHYCLGAGLAKLQAEIALDRLVVQREGLRLAVGRDELEEAHWPGEGNHLVRVPVRI